MRFLLKITLVGFPPFVGLLKVFLFSRTLDPEIFKNYSIFIFSCTILATYGGFASMSRLATRFIRGPFPQKYSKNLIFSIPLSGVHLSIFSVIILLFFEFPLKYNNFILFYFISCLVVMLGIQVNSVFNSYNSRLTNYSVIFTVGLIRNLVVIIIFYISLENITLNKLIFYEALGSALMLIAAYINLNLNHVILFKNVMRHKKFHFSLKMRNLTPFLANILSSLVTQLDSGIALKFLNPAEYKNFYFYLLSISIGNQINYIYSLLISNSIKNILKNNKLLIFLYLKNLLLIFFTIFFILCSYFLLINLYLIKTKLHSIFDVNLLIFSYSILSLAIVAYDCSSNFWLIRYGYVKFLYLTSILFFIKLLLIPLIIFFGVNDHISLSLIFTIYFVLVYLISSFIFYKKVSLENV